MKKNEKCEISKYFLDFWLHTQNPRRFPGFVHVVETFSMKSSTTCIFRNVERDRQLPRMGPAFTTTVACKVCASSTPISLFQATRTMERRRCARRRHSSHDEHPWVKTVQATLSRQSKTLPQDVTRCARATRSRVCTPQLCASRIIAVLLSHWETLRYRVSIRTNRRGTTEESFTIPAQGSHKSNAQSTHKFSVPGCPTSRRNSRSPLLHRSERGALRLASYAAPSRRNRQDGNLVLPDTTDTMRVPMQPTDDTGAKYSTSLVNTIE